MSWPSLDQSIKAIDVSINQNPFNNTATPEKGRINFIELAKQHPEIRCIISRMAGSSSGPDPDGPYNFDESKANGFDAAVYVNINPSKTVSSLVVWWKSAFGIRKPKLIRLDCEITGGQKVSVITQHIKDCLKAIKDNWPDSFVDIYTAAWWWDPNVIHGWEGDWKFWLAHYPYFFQDQNGKWRTAYYFEEVDKLLPISNNFTPRLPIGISTEMVVTFQFTDTGILLPITRLPSYSPRVDLNYTKAIYHKEIYEAQPPPQPPIEKVKVEVVVPKGKTSVVVTEI